MALYPELEGLSLDELIACFQGPPLDGEEYAAAYYDDVAVRIRRKGAAGVDFLLGQIEQSDTDRLGAIFLALTFPRAKRAGLRDILLAHLHDSRPLVVARAVDALRSFGGKEVTDAVLSLRDHPSPYVRASVLELLSLRDPAAALPLLLAALHDPDPIMRSRAVDALDDMGAVEALPALQPLLTDPDAYVRQAAQGAIKRLSEDLCEREAVAAHHADADISASAQ